MNENRKNSYLISSKESIGACTSCCPFDAKNIAHPYLNYYPSMNRTGIMNNSDACCLSKLQVDCRIQCPKKKKKKKTKQYYSSQSISSASNQLSPNPKRKKISSTNSNDSQTSSSSLSISSNTNTSEQSLFSKNSTYYQKSASMIFKSYRFTRTSSFTSDAQRYDRNRVHINESIQNLKTSIDNLTQLIVHHKNSSPSTFSFLDRFRRFFNFFKSSDNQLNEECCQILQHHHLTKENLLHIYHLFDKNDTIFLHWLRTIMPEYFLPLLLNYVKHFHSISTDND
jgi:hypothetical protein